MGLHEFDSLENPSLPQKLLWETNGLLDRSFRRASTDIGWLAQLRKNSERARAAVMRLPPIFKAVPQKGSERRRAGNF